MDAKTHSGFAILSSSAKVVFFTFISSKASLNDQIAVRAEIFLHARCDLRENRVHCLLGHLALGNQSRVSFGDLVLAALSPLLLDIAECHFVAVNLCKCPLAMPCPIVPAPITPTFIVLTSIMSYCICVPAICRDVFGLSPVFPAVFLAVLEGNDLQLLLLVLLQEIAHAGLLILCLEAVSEELLLDDDG